MIPYSIMFYDKAYPNRRTIAWLGDTPPTPSGGGGGWTKVPRPKRSAITFWTGRDATMTMSIPIVMGSNLDPITAQQPASTDLSRMFRPFKDDAEPAVVKIMSPGDIVPYQDLAWVISDLQWGDGSSDEQGNRTLQKLVVVLDEYVADVRLTAKKITKPKPHTVLGNRTLTVTGNQHTAIYVVKAGETLTSIAKKLRLPSWRDIASLQVPPIRDPRQITVGQKLIVPSWKWVV